MSWFSNSKQLGEVSPHSLLPRSTYIGRLYRVLPQKEFLSTNQHANDLQADSLVSKIKNIQWVIGINIWSTHNVIFWIVYIGESFLKKLKFKQKYKLFRIWTKIELSSKTRFSKMYSRLTFLVFENIEQPNNEHFTRKD